MTIEHRVAYLALGIGALAVILIFTMFARLGQSTESVDYAMEELDTQLGRATLGVGCGNGRIEVGEECELGQRITNGRCVERYGECVLECDLGYRNLAGRCV